MRHHAPAAFGPQINIGCDHRLPAARIPSDADMLVDAVHRDHHARQLMLAAQLKRQLLAAREGLPPGFPHLLQAHESRPLRMHAIDVVVVGPHHHHGLQVAFGKSIVERGFGVLGGWEERSGHG